MKFSESLKKNHQFRFVYKYGRSYANKYLVMYIKENGGKGEVSHPARKVDFYAFHSALL